jgi:hypothetical protein
MSNLFLTRDELADLTERKQKGKVIAWLVNNGYKFDLAADGWPKVLRAAVESKLMAASGKRTSRKTEPDFSAYGQTTKAA